MKTLVGVGVPLTPADASSVFPTRALPEITGLDVNVGGEVISSVETANRTEFPIEFLSVTRGVMNFPTSAAVSW